MAEEIQHLLARFGDDLHVKEKSSSKVPLHTQFVELKKLIEEKLGPSLTTDEFGSMREKLYSLNNVLTECRMLSKHKLYSLDQLVFLCNTKKSLRTKIQLERSNFSSQASLSKNAEIFQWSSRSLGASKVHGFDVEVMSLKRLLLQRGSDDRFKAIGIVGKVGVGKTTLAQVMFNKQEVKNYFLPRIWVCMSKLPNEKNTEIEIVKRMLRGLGVEEEIIESASQKHGLPALIYALHLQLRGKRYLIVFDDAWNTDGWYEKLDSWSTQDEKWGDKLAYGLPKGYGGTVIITTRTEEVAKKMVGEENIYRLLPLSNPESCWLIFKDSAEKDGKKFSPPNEESIKEEIQQKCDGLPSAAKMLGQLMSDEAILREIYQE